jgi:hypothetical protein
VNAKNGRELPDLFLFQDGTRVQSVADWDRRRRELLGQLLDIEYGHLPPVPMHMGVELIFAGEWRQLAAKHCLYRIVPEPEQMFGFTMDLLIPKGNGPFPAVVIGDTCWDILNDEIKRVLLSRNFIIAQFNRVELAPDNGRADRISGLYRLYPEGDFGAVAAWAWGYHRCVDALCTLDVVAKDKISAVGASRGGKAALLAGATDERIAITAPNDSGCSGAGCYRFQGEGSETLKEMIEGAAHWLSPNMRQYVGRANELPFDQHALKAVVAPRALLTTEALGDHYANPTGTWLTYLAAREVYRFLGKEEQIGIHYREGGHDHILADWEAFLDFASWMFNGVAPARSFNQCPFSDLPVAFSWAKPEPK